MIDSLWGSFSRKIFFSKKHLTIYFFSSRILQELNITNGCDEEWSWRKTAQRADGWCESVCYISLSSHFWAGDLKLMCVGESVNATWVHRGCQTSKRWRVLYPQFEWYREWKFVFTPVSKQTNRFESGFCFFQKVIIRLNYPWLIYIFKNKI